MFSFDEAICKEILMDHISNPRNLNKKHDNYLYSKLKNPSCGDEIIIYVKLENELVKDVTYEIVGCSICKASASIMSELLIGKTRKEVDEFINEFNKMVTGEEYNTEILREATSLQGVFKSPPRIKCAMLGYKAFENAIKEVNND